jgi:hypothetical protein
VGKAREGEELGKRKAALDEQDKAKNKGGQAPSIRAMRMMRMKREVAGRASG